MTRSSASGASAVSDQEQPDAPDLGVLEPAALDPAALDPAALDPDRRVAKATKRHRRRGRIAVAAALSLMLLIAGGLFGFAYWASHHKAKYLVPQHVAKQRDGIIAGGSGPIRVDVYVDYQCPACKTFQASAAGMLDQFVAANAITLVYHPLALLNADSKTQYSMRAADAAACASDVGAYLSYSSRLFVAQPKVKSAGLTDDQLVQIGGRDGMIDPRFAQCVRSGKYDKWIASENAVAAKKHIMVPPTVLVNGSSIAPSGTNPTAAELKAAIG